MRNSFIIALLCLIPAVFFHQGCRFLGADSDRSVLDNAEIVKQVGNVRSISFRLVLPAKPPQKVFSPGGEACCIRAASDGTTPEVKCELILINVGDREHPRHSIVKSIRADPSGMAQLVFESIPAKPAVAIITIEHGNIAGYSHFHGAQDLKEGVDNVIDIAPMESRELPDYLAEIALRLVEESEYFEKITFGLIARIRLSLGSFDAVNGNYDSGLAAFLAYLDSLKKIELGLPAQVADAQVTPSGGLISIRETGNPLDGVEISFPAGAFESTAGVSVSTAEITAHTFGTILQPSSPLLIINTGGAVIEAPIQVTLPITAESDETPILLFYDSLSGRIEVLPVYEIAQNTLSGLVQKVDSQAISGSLRASAAFSPVGGIFIANVKTSDLDGSIDNVFLPGRDGWPNPNYGSVIEPEGICAGMTIGAAWFFLEHPTRNLFTVWNEGTPGIWWDDDRSIRFASILHHEGQKTLFGLYALFGPGERGLNHYAAYIGIKAGLKLFNQPQFLAIYDTNWDNGHALLVYGYDGSALLVYDPNFPHVSETPRTVVFNYGTGSFNPYYSVESSDKINKDSVQYVRFSHFPKSFVNDWDTIPGYFYRTESRKYTDDPFPAIAITTVGDDDQPLALHANFSTRKNHLAIRKYQTGWAGSDGRESTLLDTVTGEVVETYSDRDFSGETYELFPLKYGQNSLKIAGFIDGEWAGVGNFSIECLGPVIEHMGLSQNSLALKLGETFDLSQLELEVRFADGSAKIVQAAGWQVTSGGGNITDTIFKAPDMPADSVVTAYFSEAGGPYASTTLNIHTEGFSERFAKDETGVITDYQTGLYWLANTDEADWFTSRNWSDLIALKGGDWRLATPDEIASFAPAAREAGLVSQWGAWSCAITDSQYARAFNIGYAETIGFPLTTQIPALAVKSVASKNIRAIVPDREEITMQSHGVFDLDQITVTALYSDGSGETVPEPVWLSDTGEISGSLFTAPLEGNSSLECFHLGKRTELTAVTEKTGDLVGITPLPASFSRYAGLTFDLRNVSVTASYSDGYSRQVSDVYWDILSGEGTINGTIFTAPGNTGETSLTCRYFEGGLWKASTVTVKILPVLTELISSINQGFLEYGQSFDLRTIAVTALYSDGSQKSLTDNSWIHVSGVGTIENGFIKAPSVEGEGIIRYVYGEGDSEFGCVSKSVQVSFIIHSNMREIRVEPSSVELGPNEQYLLSQTVVKVVYADGSTKTVSDASWVGIDGPGSLIGGIFTASSSSGKTRLFCNYTEGGLTLTGGLGVMVVKNLTSISLDPANLTVNASSTLNLDSVKVTAHYLDGSSEVVSGVSWVKKSGDGTLSGRTYSAPENIGAAVLTCDYAENLTGRSADLAVTVVPPKTLESISLYPSMASTDVNSEYNLDNVLVTAHYTDGSEQSVFPAYWMLKSGQGSVSDNIFTAPSTSGESILECGHVQGLVGKSADFTLTIRQPQSPPADMVLIPAGSFTMGDAFNENYWDALPLHIVNLKAFYMARHVVIADEWNEILDWSRANGYAYTFNNVGQWKAADHPIQSISWFDAVKWCNAKSEKEGLTPVYYVDSGLSEVYRSGEHDIQSDCVNWNATGYRLPTEAEWEKAARGGLSGKRFPWGDTISHARGNYYADLYNPSYDESSGAGYHPDFKTGDVPYTSPPGSFDANGFGLFDMSGNVYEWCWDRYGGGYYVESSTDDPKGSTTGSERIVRGGGWATYSVYCTVASRYYAKPITLTHYYGLRLVRNAGE